MTPQGEDVVLDDEEDRSEGGGRAALVALALAFATLALPGATAAHCPEDTLAEVVVACVFECGSFFPFDLNVLSYCLSNNGRCPGIVDRMPDVPPYFESCARDDAETCDPPPAIARLEICNQV